MTADSTGGALRAEQPRCSCQTVHTRIPSDEELCAGRANTAIDSGDIRFAAPAAAVLEWRGQPHPRSTARPQTGDQAVSGVLRLDDCMNRAMLRSSMSSSCGMARLVFSSLEWRLVHRAGAWRLWVNWLVTPSGTHPPPPLGVFGRKLIQFMRLRVVCVDKNSIPLDLRLNIRLYCTCEA